MTPFHPTLPSSSILGWCSLYPPVCFFLMWSHPPHMHRGSAPMRVPYQPTLPSHSMYPHPNSVSFQVPAQSMYPHQYFEDIVPMEMGSRYMSYGPVMPMAPTYEGKYLTSAIFKNTLFLLHHYQYNIYFDSNINNSLPFTWSLLLYYGDEHYASLLQKISDATWW